MTPRKPARRKSKMGRSPSLAQTERDALGRLMTALDEPLFERLTEMHRTGRDFRNVTALRCGVHPKMLSKWLRKGESEEGTIHARLFLAFGQIEGEIRAGYIAEIENTETSREETTFENGLPARKVVVQRRTAGVQWLMEKRFRQYRADWAPKEDETEIAFMLAEQQTQGLSLEAALHIARELAKNMPEQLRPIFEAARWVQLPENAHGQQT